MKYSDEVSEDNSKKAISRRGLIKSTGAFGIAAAVPATFFGRPAFANTPKKGGHLRIGTVYGSVGDTLDPTSGSSGATLLANLSRLCTLTSLRADGTLEPSAASEWSSDVGAKTWTFKLRLDVTFHSGKSLTADDVIATIARHTGENSKSPFKAYVKNIAEMRKDGDHVVVIELLNGNADFPYLLSASQMGILPSQDGSVDATTTDGAGAFVIEEFDPGVVVKFRRNESYFGTAPHLDSAEVVTIRDAAARQAALLTGAVDVIDKVNTLTANRLEAKSGIQLLNIPSTLHYNFAMNTDLAPFDNNDVRLALKYSVNREELLQKVLNGYGTLGNDQPISPAYKYFNSELPQRSYDPDKAKFHLNKAGLTSADVELTASPTIFPNAMDAVVLYKEQAAEAGINLTPNQVSADGYWSNTWMKSPWAASYWSGRPTEDWMLSQIYSGESSWNETRWSSPRFDELLTMARVELDESKRGEMYGEMQQLIHEDGGAVIPLFANHLIGYSDKVGHPETVAGNWDLDGNRILERWWIN